MIEISPGHIYLWLLRTSRLASTDQRVHVQAEFGRWLGRDGSFVSHVESGRRQMPADVRERWLAAIDLDAIATDDFLADIAADFSQFDLAAWQSHGRPDRDLGLFDAAIDGVPLSARDWADACRATAGLEMPRAVRRFCRLVTDALATASPAQYTVMSTAMRGLPVESLVDTIRETVEAAPARGYQLMDILAALDGTHSGPLLRQYLRTLPDPWMLRSIAEAMRRLVCRGHLTYLADDPHELQGWLVESLADAPSWTSRIELANLAAAIGPLPPPAIRRLADDHDQDVRLTVGDPPSQDAAEVVRHLRTQVLVPAFDAMRGSATEDPLAHKLVGMMVLGRTRRTRIMAARALGLSAYRAPLAAALPALLSASSPETRRSIAQSLMYFPSTAQVRQALTKRAAEDVDADVRGRAIWSLIPCAADIAQPTLDGLLSDADESVRRCAVDLAGAAKYEQGLRRALDDSSPVIVADAKTLLASLVDQKGN
ncbi:MAG: HEAT repeat domain-containing protein [Kibdelosporangium sp.]